MIRTRAVSSTVGRGASRTRSASIGPTGVGTAASSGTIAAGTTTFVGTVPGGGVGDWLYVLVGLASTADTMATPTGWTLLQGPTDTAGTGTNRRSYTFTREIAGTADDTPTWTKTGTGGAWTVGTVPVLQSDGVDVSGVNAIDGAVDTSAIAPSLSPTVGKLLLVAGVSPTGTQIISSTTNGWTALPNLAGGPRPCFAVLRWELATATPASTFTMSSSTKWAVHVAAFKRESP